MQPLFLISSAINTKFGVFDSPKRFQQTLETIYSIRILVPSAKIILLEMAAIPLSKDQKFILDSMVDEIKEFLTEPKVQDVFKSEKWSIIKNVTEVTCFYLALDSLIKNSQLVGIDRIYKISGRYFLNKNFNELLHKDSNKIIISQRRPSQFPLVLTGIQFQYMSRLWSWPSSISPLILQSFSDGLAYIRNQIDRGRYCDIEHMLYEYLPEYLVQPVSLIGIEGELGPNGALVSD